MIGDIYEALLNDITAVDPVYEQPPAALPPPAPCTLSHLDDLNLLSNVVLYEFKNEEIAAENDILTAPINTTNTVDIGAGVTFVLEDLVKKVVPNEYAVAIKSNFCEDKIYPGYTAPVPPPKTNRGRKKKEKTGKQRKKQGNGRYFNNQITFEMRPGDTSDLFKFKVFRTGSIELPGVFKSNVDKVIFCAEKVLETISEVVPVGSLRYMCPVMRNYKFRIKIPAGCVIDMAALAGLITADQYVPSAAHPEHPSIFTCGYDRNKGKISVIFNTPTRTDRDKMATLEIVSSGKVGILGGLYAKNTRQIFNYVDSVIRANISDVFVPIPKLINAAISVEFDWNPPASALNNGLFASLCEYNVATYGDIVL